MGSDRSLLSLSLGLESGAMTPRKRTRQHDQQTPPEKDAGGRETGKRPPRAPRQLSPPAPLLRCQVPCQVLAMLVHYFFLSTFAWMLVEGLHLYSMVVKVFGSEDSKHLYYYGIGWGRRGWDGPAGVGRGRRGWDGAGRGGTGRPG